MVKSTYIFLLVLFVAASAHGKAQDSEIATQVEQFKVAERAIKASTQDEYNKSREVLSKQALAIVEKDVKSEESEILLHWILDGRIDSETARNAAEHLVEHHATSPTSVRSLLKYAQNPAGFTPRLFEGFANSDLPAELTWIVAVTEAMHQKSLLLIADEIAANGGADSQMRSMLGEDLANKLADANLEEFESRVINAFATVADQHGTQNIGGMTVNELAVGSIFAIRHLRLGKTAEQLSGSSVDGHRIDLDDYRGKVVLIDFWATWCAPCVMTLPELKKLRSEMDDSKLAIIGVSGDTEKNRLSKFIDHHEIQWPNIFDSKGVLLKRWQALSLPSYYVLDESSIVRYRGGNEDAAIAVVKSLLAVPPNGGLPFAEIAKTIFDSLDANKDRRIEPSEMPDEMKAALGRADLDSDGSLSLAEITSLLESAGVTTEAPAASAVGSGPKN